MEQHPSLWVKEYFPSLRERYERGLFSVSNYKSWLIGIGFTDIKCIPMDYKSSEKDYFLRAGQHDPERYLEDWFVKANPAFREMLYSELASGQDAIKRDKQSGELNEKITRCQREAAMSGDLGFIIAKR